MSGNNQLDRVVWLIILGIALAFQLGATRTVQGEERYSGGITYNVTSVDDPLIYIEGEGTVVNFEAPYHGYIFVSSDSPGATLNFRGEASANVVSAGPGSYVNFYAGTVDFLVSVDLDAHVTIYGEKFTVFDELKRTTYECQPGKKLSVTRARVTSYNKWDSKLFAGRMSCVPNASILLDTELRNLNVQIDVMPDSNPSVINPYSNGVVPVAVLSNETFDATKILPETVRFAQARVAASGKGKHMANAEDVDKDGDDDMVFHFRTKDLKLEEDVTKAVVELTGKLKNQVEGQNTRLNNGGALIIGTDSVYILRPKKKTAFSNGSQR
jgi:hypothetical protein